MTKHNYLIFLIILVITIPSITVFQANGNDTPGTLLILGVTSSYFNYDPNEIRTFTDNVNPNSFLAGFSLGILSGNFLIDFTYQWKIPSNDDIYQLPNNFKMAHNISMYTLEIGYLWTFLKNTFFIGPYMALSLNRVLIQLFKNVDVAYLPTDWIVKNLNSSTLSIGVGIKFFITRYLKFSIAYQYGFPNIVNYENVPVNGIRNFQPSGLIVSLTLGL